jgi:hypothetical protein
MRLVVVDVDLKMFLIMPKRFDRFWRREDLDVGRLSLDLRFFLVGASKLPSVLTFDSV